MKIIPAIDLKDGKCVRLFQGDFEQTTEYSSNPAATGERFSAMEVDDLHIVDLDGARTGAQQNHKIVAEIAGKQINIKHIDGPVGVQSRNFSNERIYSIGWQASYYLKDGIAQTYPWIEEQVEAQQALELA